MTTDTFVLRIPEGGIDALERERLLATLDRVTKPLSVREIERALRRAGVSRSQATKMSGVIQHLGIVLVAIDESERERHD